MDNIYYYSMYVIRMLWMPTLNGLSIYLGDTLIVQSSSQTLQSRLRWWKAPAPSGENLLTCGMTAGRWWQQGSDRGQSLGPKGTSWTCPFGSKALNTDTNTHPGSHKDNKRRLLKSLSKEGGGGKYSTPHPGGWWPMTRRPDLRLHLWLTKTLPRGALPYFHILPPRLH